MYISNQLWEGLVIEQPRLKSTVNKLRRTATNCDKLQRDQIPRLTLKQSNRSNAGGPQDGRIVAPYAASGNACSRNSTARSAIPTPSLPQLGS